MEFLDHREIEWARVKRAFYSIQLRFRYEYPGPVRELNQKLVVVPANNHGNQKLQNFELKISPGKAAENHKLDKFGNRVFHFIIPEIDSLVDFEVVVSLEKSLLCRKFPLLGQTEAAQYLIPTPLTSPDEKIKKIARELTRQTLEPRELAGLINQWTFKALTYGAGFTTVKTTASQALAIGTGLCQDYSHLMLSLCRTAGLPARYVSGHLLGEGGSHAWVEVLLPEEGMGKMAAIAFDPTNNCFAGMNYITVAVGRDFFDVSPTSGTFIAPYQGKLTCTKKAGLTRLEFTN